MSRHVRIALRMWPFIFGALLVFGLVYVERLMFPVVESFTVTQLTREADGVVIRGHMTKVRACEFIGNAIKSDSGATLSLKFMDDGSPGTFTRPTGSQEWGPWKIFVPVAPKVNSITLTAAHSCHPFWVTRTEIVKIIINGD